jgi:hypothetical protein
MNDPKFVKSELKVTESEELKAELAKEIESVQASEDKDIIELLVVGGCCGDVPCCNDTEGCKCGVLNEN